MTMRSKNGLIFGVINIIGNFATVFEDQAYWQRAIASRPGTTVKAYLLGGLAWFVSILDFHRVALAVYRSLHSVHRFAIPFTMATTMGLAAVALRGDPSMRTLTPADVSAGLPASAAASALLGRGGAAALLVLLFLAVTSATSAELIAVSSILTYDVYKASSSALLICLDRLLIVNILQRYVNPNANESQILRMGHAMVSRCVWKYQSQC
jgi:urea-proton symporter